ncbi:hypothetical protein AK88_01849 [Plasmodium fragile]|uniref:Uncharacterized protein n=1 Tax=Plasmodium fragile TaxID=5857 RepID=A0A0D9QNC8_PLAFR|nr:uncharacterized protein AK88_01849 [Plasmodium fragile]KJP88570.1 hypothetical protein AK88_01849 [Plasmodium fragile]
MILYKNRIIQGYYHIRYTMNIIKVHRFICILSITYLSRMILHSQNSFDTVLHISVHDRNEYVSRTNGRNLAQRYPSRAALKRAYDCALTDDEIMQLAAILHVESMIAGDIATAMILRLNEQTGHVNIEELVKNSLNRRLRVEMPHFPEDRKVTMQARLTQFVKEIVAISPLNKDIILYKLDSYKVELDESIEVFQSAAREHTEQGIYELLNNLKLIGISLNARLKTSGIIVNENTAAAMVLRIRKRVLDILEFHRAMPSRANSK